MNNYTIFNVFFLLKKDKPEDRFRHIEYAKNYLKTYDFNLPSKIFSCDTFNIDAAREFY